MRVGLGVLVVLGLNGDEERMHQSIGETFGK
jgi:hypothetical protein